MKNRRLIIGDVHGRYRALREALERAEYDEKEDILYSVGDFCDRGRDNLEVLEFLSSLENFRPVLGNHDAWLQDYLRTGYVSDNWYSNNGGWTTVESLGGVSETVKKRLSSWLDAIPYCRVEDDGIVIVHGGPVGRNMTDIARPRDWNIERDARDIPDELWDRKYLRTALLYKEWMKSDEKKDGMDFSRYIIYCYGKAGCTEFIGIYPAIESGMIFTGHSIVGDKPFISPFFHITAIDTGAASGKGRLTCMNIDSGEYWQSDRIDKIEEVY